MLNGGDGSFQITLGIRTDGCSALCDYRALRGHRVCLSRFNLNNSLVRRHLCSNSLSSDLLLFSSHKLYLAAGREKE